MCRPFRPSFVNLYHTTTMDSSVSFTKRRTSTMCIFMVIYEKNKPILYHNSSKEEIMLVLLLLLEEGRRHYGRRKAYSKKKCSIIFSFVLKLLLLYHPLPVPLLCVLQTHPSAQYTRTNTHSFSVFIFYSTIHYILWR